MYCLRCYECTRKYRCVPYCLHISFAVFDPEAKYNPCVIWVVCHNYYVCLINYAMTAHYLKDQTNCFFCFNDLKHLADVLVMQFLQCLDLPIHSW